MVVLITIENGGDDSTRTIVIENVIKLDRHTDDNHDDEVHITLEDKHTITHSTEIPELMDVIVFTDSGVQIEPTPN